MTLPRRSTRNRAGSDRRAAGRPPVRARPARTPTTRTHAVAGQMKPPAADKARRSNLTGRAAVLALVICMLAISLAYPVREYLAQRAEIAEYRAKVAAQTQRVAELAAERDRWRNPAFVKAQARQRLHFVMPGETSYVVLEPDEAPPPATARQRAQRPAQQRPWFGDLWRSVEVAGRS